MNREQILTAYNRLRKLGFWILDKNRIRAVTRACDEECTDALRFLENDGILRKLEIVRQLDDGTEIPIENGEWFDPEYPTCGAALMAILRPNSWSYISLHTILASSAMLDNPPPVLTVATYGEKGLYFSNIGGIEFFTITPDFSNPFFVNHVYNSLKYNAAAASPELALYDYLQAGFDPGLIDIHATELARNDGFPEYGFTRPDDFVSPFDIILNNPKNNERVSSHAK